jgi:2-keto-4-pentenoate hydratase/2-oxohepta-3-ene-1,7-dioic acid hydratase in catechol pathway
LLVNNQLIKCAEGLAQLGDDCDMFAPVSLVAAMEMAAQNSSFRLSSQVFGSARQATVGHHFGFNIAKIICLWRFAAA